LRREAEDISIEKYARVDILVSSFVEYICKLFLNSSVTKIRYLIVLLSQ